MNYHDIYKKLPPKNGNTWRFSEYTKFNSVSWRFLVLDRVASLGSRNFPANRVDLEAQIYNAGKQLFQPTENSQIYANWGDAPDYPDYFAIAFSGRRRSSEKWSDVDDLDLNSACAKGDFDEGGLLLLFANGSIGRMSNPQSVSCAALSDSSRSKMVAKEDLRSLGVELVLVGEDY